MAAGARRTYPAALVTTTTSEAPMSVFLLIVGVLAWAAALAGFFGAPAITQEIAAIDLFVAGSALIGASAIVDAVNKLHTTVAQAAAYINTSKRG
jgi:hypothetical protein